MLLFVVCSRCLSPSWRLRRVPRCLGRCCVKFAACSFRLFKRCDDDDDDDEDDDDDDDNDDDEGLWSLKMAGRDMKW